MTVLVWSLAVDALSYRWPRLGAIFKAPPRRLVDDGILDRRTTRRELMNEAEVQSQLRLHGIEDLDNVEHAYLEPNGMVSIVLRGPPETAEAPQHPEL